MKWLSNTVVCNDWLIEDLALYPQWFDEVVAWHHSEWLRNADDQGAFDEHGIDRLLQRRASMSYHLNDGAIPSTFIAHNKQRPLGSVSLIDYPNSIEPTRVWLTNLYVDTPFQQQGIGSALVSFAESFAKKNGIFEVSLYTFDAKEYYLQRGWQWLSVGQLHGRGVDVFSKRIK